MSYKQIDEQVEKWYKTQLGTAGDNQKLKNLAHLIYDQAKTEQREDKCELCESGVEHIGPYCHNYSGHIKKYNPSKDMKPKQRGESMKALLMWGDNLIRVEYIKKITPDIKIPISRVFNVAYMQEPEIAATHKTNFITFVFKCVQPGNKYSVYQLDGFDNIGEA